MPKQGRGWLAHLYGLVHDNSAETDKMLGRFAHYATRGLAMEEHQPGTCKSWERGFCSDGQACFYEHRETGLDGLYQTGETFAE